MLPPDGWRLEAELYSSAFSETSSPPQLSGREHVGFRFALAWLECAHEIYGTPSPPARHRCVVDSGDQTSKVIQAFWLVALILVTLTSVPIGARHQQASPKDSMAGMDMSGDMKDMGPSMAAMSGHMYMTQLRPKQPGDEEKVKAIIAQVKASIERYRDYHKALEDGYVIANPKVNEPQFHFNNKANLQEAERHFDPTRPSSLLYFQTPTQRYKLEGVMFTVPPMRARMS